MKHRQPREISDCGFRIADCGLGIGDWGTGAARFPLNPKSEIRNPTPLFLDRCRLAPMRRSIFLPLLVLVGSVTAFGQNDWPGYARDYASTSYSTLNDITPANVA